MRGWRWAFTLAERRSAVYLDDRGHVIFVIYDRELVKTWGPWGTEVAKGCKSINIFGFAAHMNEVSREPQVAPK